MKVVDDLSLQDYFQVDIIKAMDHFDKPADSNILQGEPEKVLRDLMQEYGFARKGVKLMMGPQVAKYFKELSLKKGR
jgi:hypothetical protein